MATCMEQYSPRQMSVNHPDATSMLPRFSSPVESRAEVGSRSAALHISPNAITNLASGEWMVGYAFAEMTEGGYRERRVNHLRRTWSTLSINVVGSSGVSAQKFCSRSLPLSKWAARCLGCSVVRVLFVYSRNSASTRVEL